MTGCTNTDCPLRAAAEVRQVGVDWRDATWAAVDQHQNDVASAEELFALLPPIPHRPQLPILQDIYSASKGII